MAPGSGLSASAKNRNQLRKPEAAEKRSGRGGGRARRSVWAAEGWSAGMSGEFRRARFRTRRLAETHVHASTNMAACILTGNQLSQLVPKYRECPLGYALSSSAY